MFKNLNKFFNQTFKKYRKHFKKAKKKNNFEKPLY
jgi:hypothetical protein